MTSLLATRAARRRGAAFAALLVTSTLMMAFSSNPTVRELQNGVSFAFRPLQGAIHDVAAGVASVAGAFAEIDRLRVDNTALLMENERLRNENARNEATYRENGVLTGLLQLRAGLEHKTVPATVIARESSEFRRLVVLDRGSNDGIAVGDVAIVAGRALAGRVTEVGPDSAKVVLLTDGEFTVIGQTTTSAATGEVIGQLGAGVLVMRQIDSSEVVTVGDVAIVAGRALAGRVTEVGPDSAKVVLLTDGEFKVIGQLSATAATGEVIGQLGAGVLVMRQIDSSETVTVGDEVVTAGIELGGGVRSPYPKGLLLGQVIDVRRDANDVVQTAYLQPAADLDRLEYVLVITSYEGGLPPLEQQPIDCNEPDGTLPEGEQPCYTPSEAPSGSPAAQ